MHFVCISASNIRHAKENIISLKAYNLIVELLKEKLSNIFTSDIIPLDDFEMEPCIGCGACYENDECVRDHVFNQLYSLMRLGDGLFVVSPHYAPFPAKLCML
jgi:multimeric flavodoxin WrbA